MSLKPLAAAFGKVLGQEVAFAGDCSGAPAEKVAGSLKDGGVALLENLRFHAREEANDQGFAKQLAALGDVYVNDAFSAAHRAHASTEGIARLLPSAAGRLMQAELEHLGAPLAKPKRPLAALVGGAKNSTKLELPGHTVPEDHMLALGDVYVNDAFSAAHRAHASTEGIARLLPSAAGRLMQAELEHLGAALEKPKRPLAAIVGGAKISTKLDLLGNLVAEVDMLVIGGGMANTFLNAIGVKVGKSLCEHDMAGTAREILEKAKKASCDVVLPTDAVVAKEFAAGAASETVSVKAVPDDRMILDVGPATAEHLARRLADCATLVWNGPLGAFEIPPFDAATNSAAQAAAKLTKVGDRTRGVVGKGVAGTVG